MVSLPRSLLWGHRTLPSIVSRPSQPDRTICPLPLSQPSQLQPYYTAQCSLNVDFLFSCLALTLLLLRASPFHTVPVFLIPQPLIKYYLFLKSNPYLYPAPEQPAPDSYSTMLSNYRFPFLCCALNYLLRLSSTPIFNSKSYICKAA